jgi:hypothetical protein
MIVAMKVLGKFSELGFVCWATVVETVFMNISHGERIDVFKIEFVLCGELLAISDQGMLETVLVGCYTK